MAKHCSVVCDTAAGLLCCELELADEASIAVALDAARELLGEQAADWQAPCGIFGQQRERSHIPAEGDRIELYRPLKIDPRTQRRQRAQQRPGK